MPLKKNYEIFLVFLLVVGIASYYTMRVQLPPADFQTAPLPDSPLRPGNTSEPTSSLDSLPNQEEQPAHSGTGSQIRIETSTSGSSSQLGSTVKIGIYESDPVRNQAKTFSSIDWSLGGPIIAGQSRNSSRVYFRNEGDTAVTLYLSSQAWSFRDYRGKNLSQEYEQYFSLTWDYDNSTLKVNQVMPVVFTLSVSPGIIDVVTFSFDLVVLLS